MNANWISSLRVPGLFVLYVFTSCLGLYLLKVAPGWKTLSFVSGAALYGLGALQWVLILRTMPLSISFPVAAGALMIGTVLTGVVFLKEVVTFSHILGAILIFTGIAIIASTK